MGRIVLGAVIFAVAWLLEAWGLMLTIGIAHRDWWHLIPPIGWHASVPLAFVAVFFQVLSGLLAIFLKEVV